MPPVPSPAVRAVDFTAPGTVDPADFGLDGLTSAAARISVDLSPTSGLGPSSLAHVRRGDAASLSASGKSWFFLQTAVGPGVLMVDHALAVVVADTLMGGTGAIEARPLTSVEERVLVPHLQRAVQPLSAAFSPAGIAPLEVRDPGRGPLGLRGDMLVAEVTVCSFDGASELGTLQVAVPAPSMTRGQQRGPLAGAGAVGDTGSFLKVPLTLSLLTEPAVVPAASVHSLAPGDVLSLRHRCDRPLRLCVEGYPVGRASLSRTADSLIAQVLSLLDEPADPGYARHNRRLGVPAVLPSLDQAVAEEEKPTQEEEVETTDDLTDDGVAAAVAAAEDALEGAISMPAAPAAGSDRPPLALGLLADVPVEVSVEVGRTSINLRDAVSLGPGQVVTLDAEADSPATVLVNGRVVARGQVVVVEDVYGVRITELVGE